MAIDRFALCPGGTGKKIKFCHSECVGFLEKVQKLMDGEQLRAALQLVDQTLARDPDRPCAWSFKCLLERATGNVEQFAKAAEEFSRRFPKSPVALAEQSLSHIFQGRVSDALDALGQSIEASDEQKLIYVRQSAAAATIGEALFEHNYVPAAVEILTIFRIMSPNDGSPVAELLDQIMTSPDILLEIRELQWDGLFASDRYRGLMEVGDRLAVHLRWRELENHLKEYLAREPEDARVWHYLGVVQMWLMNYEDASKSFARAGELEKNDRLSVFSLCRALSLSRDFWGNEVRTRGVTVVVNDPDRLKEAILSDRRILARKPEAESVAEDLFPLDGEEVPPELIFVVLRHAMPEGQKEEACLRAATTDEMPIVGYASYYGRQTDRPARLLFRDVPESDLELLKEMVKGWLGRDDIEWSVEPTSQDKDRLIKMLSDCGTIADLDSSVNFQLELKTLILKWLPQMKFNCLDNSSFVEAVKDQQKRRWVMAVLTVIEARLSMEVVVKAIGELRQQLGLVFEDDLAVDLKLFRRIPLSLTRVLDLTRQTTEVIATLYSLAIRYRDLQLIRQIAGEIIRRKDEDGVPPRLVGNAYLEAIESAFLLRHIDNFDEISQLAKEGIAFLEQHNVPHGMLHTVEFRVAVFEGNKEKAMSTFEHMTREHGNEGDVMEFVQQFMGLLGHIKSVGSGEERTVSQVGASGSAIWTPNSETGGGGSQKKIWIPGAD